MAPWDCYPLVHLVKSFLLFSFYPGEAVSFGLFNHIGRRTWHFSLIADSVRTPPELSMDVLLLGPVHLVEALDPNLDSSHL